jgi:hypothetical protein
MEWFKIITHLLKEGWISLMNSIVIGHYKRMARQLHRQTGKRYWVLNIDGKIGVYTRDQVKGSKYTIKDFLEQAIYRIG